MNKPKTVEKLASITRNRQRIEGWTKYVAGADPDTLPPLELEGYTNAADSYEVWRDVEIGEYEQRQ